MLVERKETSLESQMLALKVLSKASNRYLLFFNWTVKNLIHISKSKDDMISLHMRELHKFW